ncbi:MULTISPECIES: hypothetical protein [Actinoalloteichus]|uniref:Uncharacterized protein n=1 Tax=Actinoalloteichus fjordicus TaxID=1612552 RepID=A0AAC9LD15_9PSEU|nr:MULTISPECIES: hypothetical protein [Actinoalloteichus]APU15613.1 hypothetical protein UA74_17925 [Actinoalloteichus fjordicus]APU21673.1 hypothetical protein UA75_18415 [Actinoalloteichus sp. GBA129-24]
MTGLIFLIVTSARSVWAEYCGSDPRRGRSEVRPMTGLVTASRVRCRSQTRNRVTTPRNTR